MTINSFTHRKHEIVTPLKSGVQYAARRAGAHGFTRGGMSPEAIRCEYGTKEAKS